MRSDLCTLTAGLRCFAKIRLRNGIRSVNHKTKKKTRSGANDLVCFSQKKKHAFVLVKAEMHFGGLPKFHFTKV